MEFNCKAQYTGIGQFVRCLEQGASKCPFGVPLGSTYFCKSPHWAHFYSKQNMKAEENLTLQETRDKIKMVS